MLVIRCWPKRGLQDMQHIFLRANYLSDEIICDLFSLQCSSCAPGFRIEKRTSRVHYLRLVLLFSSRAGYARLGKVMSCMMYAARCSAWTICTDWSCVREITVPLLPRNADGTDRCCHWLYGNVDVLSSRLCAGGVSVAAFYRASPFCFLNPIMCYCVDTRC